MNDELNEEKPTCPDCGSELEEVEGELICPNCDQEIDYFGDAEDDEDEEKS